MSSEPSAPEPRRRRPFEGQADAPPFYRTPEFRRFAFFGVPAALVLALFAYSRFVASRNAAATTVVAAPMLSPAEIESHRAQLATVFEGGLTDTQNGDDFLETTGYRTLIRAIKSYSPEEVSARATRYLDYDAVLHAPDAYRGEFFRVRGLIAGMSAIKLDHPVFETRDVYRGVITEADATEGVVFDMPDPPAGFDMRRNAVDVEGILYRTVRYENQKGVVTEAPYMIVRNLRAVVKPDASSAGFLADHSVAMLVGMGLVIMAAALLMYLVQYRSRRRRVATAPAAPGFRELFDKKAHEARRPLEPRPPH